MPIALKGLQVFIATPDGLDDIRKCFQKVVTAYNVADAVRRGVIFVPVAWKDAFGGRGRPQDHINRELAPCDYFVMVLHDRWGTPSGTTDRHGRPYRSGVEEEYCTAKELHQAGSMLDMLVFFRAVDPHQRADPGEQLSQVLAFRQELEAEHSDHYRTFELEEEFADELRRHLAKWLFESQTSEPSQEVPAPTSASSVAETPSEGTPLERASALILAKKFTEAETLLAGLTAAADNAEAVVLYAELLARLSQRRQAAQMFGEAIRLALAHSEEAVHARALVGLAKLHEAKRQWPDAANALRSAIAIFKERRDLHGLADALIRSGEVHRNQGADEKARVAYDDALAAVDGHQLPALAARALSGLGELLRKRERWAEAQAALAKAIDMKRAAGDPDLADLHASLGGALEGAGDYSAAEAKYRESLMGFEASGNEAGVADAADHLGQVCLMQSKLEDAEENFEKSAITFESVQLIDAAADAYVSLARVQDQRGDLSAAELSFKNALALTDRRMEADPGEARDEIYRSLEVIYAKQGSPPRTA